MQYVSVVTLMPARSLFTTSVAKASDSTSSAMMSSGLWLFTVDSSSGMIELIVDTYRPETGTAQSTRRG